MLSPGTPQTSPPSWRRTLAAWLMGCALIVGGLAPHAPAEEHVDSPLQGTEIDGAAQHPQEPAHFEGSRPETHPACPACLLHIQGSSLLTALTPLPGLRQCDTVSVRPGPDVAQPSFDRKTARGPPALS